MITPDLYKKATEVIGKIIDLKTQEAVKVIDKECANDEKLKNLVEQLLGKIEDNNKTIQPKEKLKVKNKHIVSSVVVNKWWSKIFNDRKYRFFLLTSILILLAFFSLLIRMQVRHQLIEDTSRYQYDQLLSQHYRMEEWIRKGKNTIQASAADPVVIKIARECDSLEKLDPTLRQLNQIVKSGRFLKEYKQANSFSRIPSGIISKNGALVLTSLYTLGFVDSVVGIRLGKEVYNAYLKGMQNTVFVKPLSGQETIYKLPDSTNREVACVFLSPVFSKKGELLGVLYNNYKANEEFSKILSRVHFGKEGETYAFDSYGRMLSSGRFVDQIRAIPYFNLSEDDETIYNVILKDPGGDLITGYKPPSTASQMPYVEPLLEIWHVREKSRISEDSIIYSTSDKPYRSYLGKEVISRWMWWEKYKFGIITEVSLKEAIGPLRYFDYAFLVFFIIIIILSYYVYVSNIKIFRFGKKIDEFKQLGQYRLLEKIGEGGFGEVYKAEHELLKTPVAIKLLKKKFNGTDILDRFEKEVTATASLVHPNTIKVFDFGTSEDGQFYYIMEYLKGISLDKMVQNGKRIEVARGIHVLLNICYSLQEAHKKGLVHRDIKPGNIMICNLGGAYDVVKVLDFGLVKRIDTDPSDYTQVNRIGGTPMFMAPERLRDPFNADHRVDIYSIGALGIYMFSGKYLLELVTQKMLSGEQTLQADFKSQLIEEADVPDSLKKVLLDCLNFAPQKRPANIDVLIELFEELRDNYTWSRKNAENWWHHYDVYGSD